MTTHSAPLLHLVSQAVAEFFASSAGTTALVEGEPATFQSNETYAASLGFAGTQLKGAIVIICDRSVLDMTNPQREFKPELDEADCSDWCGEIANQIVGNLKRIVAGYKVDFQLSTPAVVRGKEFASAKRADVLWFKLGTQPVMVQLTAEIADGVSFEGEPEAVAQAAGGDALLF